MFKGKKATLPPTNDEVIQAASSLYSQSVKMFIEAEEKIDLAQSHLDSTIDNIDSAIAALVAQKEHAASDKSRNENFKIKLQSFTS